MLQWMCNSTPVPGVPASETPRDFRCLQERNPAWWILNPIKMEGAPLVNDTPGESLDETGLPESYRPRQCSSVWQELPDGWRTPLKAAVDKLSAGSLPGIFFRGDDIGAGGRAFEAVCGLFRRHGVPLGMAVVPAWLSDARMEHLFRHAPLDESLWGWHQHGWRHVNRQKEGERSEFGEHRPFESQWKDIRQGFDKLSGIFGDRLLPVFTPPWNRMSAPTIRIVQELGFKGISLSGPMPRGGKIPIVLKNLRVLVDLHARSDKNGGEDYRRLTDEIAGLSSRREPAGITIHHQQMNRNAFDFLDEFLGFLKAAGVPLLGFRDILEGNNGA